MHAKDIGVSKGIEMDIQLKSDQPRIQKYFPIPHNIRDQVKLILDQLIKFKIIRECPEPSLYCSNLLAIKKKDGKDIRVLFDGRLLNYDTVALPLMLVQKFEAFAHLAGKKFVSIIDLSDAFFHILLSKAAQPLTAFYSQAHGKRFCFTRAPQGLKNSPLYLKLLMDKVFGDIAHIVIHNQHFLARPGQVSGIHHPIMPATDHDCVIFLRHVQARFLSGL